jgi:hypothetical protein
VVALGVGASKDCKNCKIPSGSTLKKTPFLKFHGKKQKKRAFLFALN